MSFVNFSEANSMKETNIYKFSAIWIPNSVWSKVYRPRTHKSPIFQHDQPEANVIVYFELAAISLANKENQN